MKDINFNLEQPESSVSSHGEGILQNGFFGQEDNAQKTLGSKDMGGEGTLPSAFTEKLTMEGENNNLGNEDANKNNRTATEDCLDDSLNNPIANDNLEAKTFIPIKEVGGVSSPNFDDEELAKPASKKFKSVEALSRAYDSLQSDYTKKCQALANLKKIFEDNREKFLPQPDFSCMQEELDEFLLKNPDAKAYEGEIAKTVLTDIRIATSKKPFDEAWDLYKQNNFVGVKNQVKNDDYVNSYILNNEELKNKIINEYFSKISLTDVPNLINSKKGSQTIVSPIQKPKSISEAGKIVEDIFS